MSELNDLKKQLTHEIQAAYRKGFMKGYNQAEVLIDPCGEAENLACKYASCNVLVKEIKE